MWCLQQYGLTIKFSLATKSNDNNVYSLEDLQENSNKQSRGDSFTKNSLAKHGFLDEHYLQFKATPIKLFYMDIVAS